MEPRIATLLGGSPSERTSLDVFSLPPLSTAPRQSPTKRQKTSVPIAGVLNDETPTTHTHVTAASSSSSLPPFSGRLSDLLLDPSQQHSNKRKRPDEHTAPPAVAASDNNPLTLPKPPQLPKKPAKRPRIPPLLQGLHQPPPLPEGRIFPPITADGGSFGRKIGERVGLRSPPRPDSYREQERGEFQTTDTSQESVDELLEDQRGEVGKPASRCLSDKENQEHATKTTGPITAAKAKEAKKRNKWSEQETNDLLLGVSRFGIGNWKKILQCTDFTFHQRTAVDLKDRFRTCCPGEGLKLKIRKRRNKDIDASTQEPSPATAPVTPPPIATSASHEMRVPEPSPEDTAKVPRPAFHKNAPAELAKIGIHQPFVKSKRRERREFTEQDDQNLMKGYEKHAFSWLSMKNDVELGFFSRRSTDLRDRFRIRYPELFSKAGYKLKPKHELVLKEKEKEDILNQDLSSPGQRAATQKAGEAPALVNPKGRNQSQPASTNADLGTLALREPLQNSFPSPLEDFAELASEEDLDGSRSPIVLNRNIFEWADANPSSTTSVTTANLPAVTSLMGESHLNFFNGTDGMHINPMATLNLPMALLTNNILSATPVHVSMPGTSRGNAQYLHNVPTSTSSTSAQAPGNSKQSVDPLLRTPNLPTIVFPHVPASSARNAVHNLPPPTDLLSGLDIDSRDSTTSGVVLDDGMGFALSAASANGYDPNATLAPMMGSGSGRAILGFERHVLDDLTAEKRT
jgi:hypothetical protein